MPETFLAKWKHRIHNSWLILTGQAWIGYGNPMDWEYVGKEGKEKSHGR
jgi:hypothetical protein